jgi:hypothetical protein
MVIRCWVRKHVVGLALEERDSGSPTWIGKLATKEQETRQGLPLLLMSQLDLIRLLEV